MNANESATLPTGNAEQAQSDIKTEVATISITRKQLYERIWAESVAHVAPTLCLWPRRLSTICENNRIPMPGRGYWYCGRADRKTMRHPLPDADQDWEISFVPSQPGPKRPEPPVPIAPQIVVQERIARRSHRLVQEAKAVMNARPSRDYGRCLMPKGSLGIHVSPEAAKRSLLIMDALLKACEARRWVVSATPEYRSRTVVKIQDCEVHLYLQEGLRQAPRELRESEKNWAVEGLRKRAPYDLVPNGRLTLTVDCVGTWYGAKWQDGKRRRLEDMLDAVMACIERAPEDKIKADKARAEAKKRAAEAEERRRVAEQLRREEEERQAELRRARERVLEAEQARVDELLADAEAWEESRRLRAYIKACLSQARRAGKQTGRNSEFGKWLIWARAQGDRLDPLVKSPPSILDTEPPPSPPVEEEKSFADIMNSLGQR